MSISSVLICVYVMGFLTGIVSLVLFTLFASNKYIKGKGFSNSETDILKSKVSTAVKQMADVEQRMNKVKDITLRQLDLQGQIEMPQKSGLDGKYKNLMSGEMKSLEEEKVAILSSILTDGYDPTLTVGNMDGTTETIKLSEFMTRSGYAVAPKPAVKQFGKFTVYSNDEKSDKTDT